MAEAAQKLKADYLIVGSGAMGMAFADVIVTESDKTIVLVDEFAKPGGHWNIAYPFVQLHQPSAYYGVSSKELGSARREVGGLNDGLANLSSGPEILAYYDAVLQEHFLPTGRVQYFPMCTYAGNKTFKSKASGQCYEVDATTVVDCTFLKTSVPANHKPNFSIGQGVWFMPLNNLPTITEKPDKYVVIGGGKTGIDACLWLLEMGTDPEDITWVVSREAWLLNRQNTQLDLDFFHDVIGTQTAMLEHVADAQTPREMFEKLEECGYFTRVHEDTWPEMFHGATVSVGEIRALQSIKDVVRLGHVQALEADRIVFANGEIKTTPNTVHIDCSASALKALAPRPVFDADLITPQMVRPYQPVFSAAFIAHVALAYDGEAIKNEICAPVALPDRAADFIRFTSQALMNQYRWSQDNELSTWIAQNRLSGPSQMVRKVAPDDTEKMAVLGRFKQAAPLAVAKLQQFLRQGELN